MATAAPVRSTYAYSTDQSFFLKTSLALSGLIVFGFAQWAFRGYVVPSQVPVWVHLHALAMLGWLGLLVTQNALAGRGNLALHKRLGWSSVGLVAFIVALGMVSAQQAIRLHRAPPFFSDAWFLALTHVEVTVFATLFVAAIALRRHTQWHRRLMLGATVIVMEPALGRMVPIPLLGAALGGWVECALQFVVLAVLAVHDRRMMGRIHPATLACMGALVATHALIQALAGLPVVAAVAQAIAAG
ncbi:MAG: hypothetical protein RIS94_378 [Pseudomonadota bacterium]|jgi:hypothetical protein